LNQDTGEKSTKYDGNIFHNWGALTENEYLNTLILDGGIHNAFG
jgi:hypothetical protein